MQSSRKRSISDQNCHSSSSKRAKIGDEMTFTLSGIEIVYNESFLTSKVGGLCDVTCYFHQGKVSSPNEHFYHPHALIVGDHTLPTDKI